MQLSEKHDLVLSAFVQCRGLINSSVKKDKRNDHLKTSYATLGSVMNTIEPAMKDVGLVMIQNATVEGNAVNVTTIIMHGESFQTITFNTVVPIAKMDGQAFGSGMTYGRRYACLGVFGLVPADDDGNATKKTAQDVKRAMSGADSVDSLNKINDAAKSHFKGDSTSLNVIAAHYDKIKADLTVGGAKNFNPFPAKKAIAEKVVEESVAEESEIASHTHASPDLDF